MTDSFPPNADGWPTITVITPVYNGVDTLEDCIASVLAQHYPTLEYGVIDGGSTDGSLDVIRRHESSLAFWTSEPDNGQADALNKGLARATGELVCWLNSDDFYYPGALAAAAEAFRTDPDAPFYFGNGCRVDREGNKIAEYFAEGHVEFRRDALVFGLNCILQPSTFIRREALEQIGLLDATLHYGFDTDAWLKLSELGRPRPIQTRVAASREYAETKTARGSFERAEELRRIAQRHSGVQITPGSICYYLDTLHRAVSARPDVFPREYVSEIESFWTTTARLFSRYGAGLDGFPHSDGSRTRVGIELRNATTAEAGGIAVAVSATLHELFRQRPDIDFVVFCTVFNRETLATDAPNVEIVTLPLEGFSSELARLARSYDIDVLFRSYPGEKVHFPSNRQVVFIPDLQHEYFPEFFDAYALNVRRVTFQDALDGAAAIMTVSEFSRTTIEARVGPGRDIFVAPHGLPPAFEAARSVDASEEERATVPPGEFFLFPANLWAHKNHARLLDAFGRYLERTGSSVELVLTGSPIGWEDLRARYPSVPVRHLGYVSRPHLRHLYERALALTFFSLYEGFGIPLLEAFAVRTPVVCSNTTSLPEVAGDAAIMCDPEDVEAMSGLLEEIAESVELRSQLSAQGERRLERYASGWSDAAAELGSAIDRVRDRTGPSALGALPLVSIVTPSYNQGRFIRRTIESVLTQTYSNIEYLVVDGGSTDETLEILRSFGDCVRWISENDSGQTEAINKGVRQVSGQIVGYLNSDDVLLPHAIESVVRYFREHPECDLVFGDAEYIDEEDFVTGTYATADYSFERLMEDCCICQPAAYWRSFAGAIVGEFDESLDYVMDYDYWIRVARGGFVIQHMSATIARSRLHANAKTLRARRDIYREIFRVCREQGGYISRSYVTGFWHHVVFEGRSNRMRRFGRSPALRGALVVAHHLWLNRRRAIPTHWARRRGLAGRRRLVWRLRRTPRLFTGLLLLRLRWRTLGLHGLRRGLDDFPTPRGAQLRVNGFWPDNWVGERLEVVVGPREHVCDVCLAGYPARDMTLLVSGAGRGLGSIELREGKRESVRIQIPPGPRMVMTCAFSDHVVAADGRRVSFLLDETNLFTEEHLHTIG